MLRKLILISAVLTSVFAAASIFFSISGPDTVPGRLVAQILLAVFILAAAALAGVYAIRPGLSESLRTWMVLAGAGLIALGLVGGVLAFLNGRSSGDFEYYLFLADALFISQGGLYIMGTWWREGMASA